jgi:hypothetical protein
MANGPIPRRPARTVRCTPAVAFSMVGWLRMVQGEDEATSPTASGGGGGGRKRRPRGLAVNSTAAMATAALAVCTRKGKWSEDGRADVMAKCYGDGGDCSPRTERRWLSERLLWLAPASRKHLRGGSGQVRCSGRLK